MAGSVGRAREGVLIAALSFAACGDGSSSAAPQANGADAGAVASENDAASAEKFCETRPALQFCEDFDDGPLPGRFTTMTGEGGGALTTDATLSRSMPNSLKVTADPSRGSTVAARLEKSFSAGKKLRGFAIVHAGARAPNDGGSMQLMAMRFALAGGGRYEIALSTDATGAWAAHEKSFPKGGGNEGGGGQTFPASRGLEANAWTSIRFEVDFDGSGAGTLSVRFGADAVVEAVKLAPPPEALAPTFVLGLDGTAPSSSWSVNFDTITFSVE